MSDTSLEQTEPTPQGGGNATGQGSLEIMEVTDNAPVAAPALPTTVDPVPAAAFKRSNRSATVEHLAARRDITPVDADTAEVKQKLGELRAELTILVTDLRWGGYSVQATIERLTPLLDIGPLQAWIPALIPTILEIDRAGNLAPAWVKLAEEDDPEDLPDDTNPAETTTGRARRVAMLMLGYYKSPEFSVLLGKLAADPHSSLYATQSLVRQSTVAALQGLVGALKEARGWAKVDVIDAFATLNQTRFFEIMLASGLDDAEGLESYLAAPLYRTIPLENHLRETKIPRLAQQAALICAQVFQDTTTTINGETLPVAFDRDLPALTRALFDGAKQSPNWRNAVALHRLGLFLGRYWGEISRGTQQDTRITEPVMACLPMMPEIERWINGPGRDAIVNGLNTEEEAFGPCLKAVKDLRELRAAPVLLIRLDSATSIADREQAMRLGQICDTLVLFGERRVVGSLLQLVNRVIPVSARANRAKRRDNLPAHDAEIPASIVYAAAIRTFAQLSDRSALDLVLQASNDFDPYVRTQSLEALKSIDPRGEDSRSRVVARNMLNDPRDAVVRVACQLTAQYRDMEAIPLLQRLAETRPEFIPSAQSALRQLQGM
ncbi:MAG TPA: HEAT repeat domain-containing protein [Ktedonobacteraceae bacterium]|nr:HEAT repeat domain-containing protein [Ktedonobacteraceae bacterium]